MKVLEHGMYYDKKTKIRCSCGCRFEYENSDIVLDKMLELTTFPPQWKKFVVCPECKARIFI